MHYNQNSKDKLAKVLYDLATKVTIESLCEAPLILARALLIHYEGTHSSIIFSAKPSLVSLAMMQTAVGDKVFFGLGAVLIRDISGIALRLARDAIANPPHAIHPFLLDLRVSRVPPPMGWPAAGVTLERHRSDNASWAPVSERGEQVLLLIKAAWAERLTSRPSRDAGTPTPELNTPPLSPSLTRSPSSASTSSSFLDEKIFSRTYPEEDNFAFDPETDFPTDWVAGSTAPLNIVKSASPVASVASQSGSTLANIGNKPLPALPNKWAPLVIVKVNTGPSTLSTPVSSSQAVTSVEADVEKELPTLPLDSVATGGAEPRHTSKVQRLAECGATGGAEPRHSYSVVGLGAPSTPSTKALPRLPVSFSRVASDSAHALPRAPRYAPRSVSEPVVPTKSGLRAFVSKWF